IKNTDSNGNADLVITENSKINVRAFGYWNWASDGQIRPSSIILTLENQYNDTNFHIVNSKGEDVPHAFVIIIDSMGNEFVKQTDTMGIASAQIIQGRTNITIKSEGYKNFNTELIVSENSNSKFYLDFIVSSKIIFWNFILLILPFLSMLIIIISNKHKYWYFPALLWVGAFSVFLFLSVSHTNNFSIYFFDPLLKVPLFVPIIAFLGAISYVTVSDLKKMEKKLDAEVIKRIHCAYGRRLLMAPYIAIIALYTLSDVIQMKNLWAIVFFAYFVGLYTKAIEGTLKELGMKFLTAKQKEEISIREINDFKNSDISRLPGISDCISKKLDNAGISKIIDLIAISDKKIEEIANKTDLDKTHLRSLKEEAKKRFNH
ncbi:MAG: hypothetical protein KAJ55_12430, partial [Anaerolineales bacterium]|nr:hypothetical protein [Anaerolineales bacterium]